MVHNSSQHGSPNACILYPRLGRKLFSGMRGTLRDGRLNLYDLTLRCGENLKWRSGLLQTCLDALEYAIYRFIIPERVVVGQSDSLYTRVLPNLNRVFDWT